MLITLSPWIAGLIFVFLVIFGQPLSIWASAKVLRSVGVSKAKIAEWALKRSDGRWFDLLIKALKRKP